MSSLSAVRLVQKSVRDSWMFSLRRRRARGISVDISLARAPGFATRRRRRRAVVPGKWGSFQLMLAPQRAS